MEHEGLYYEFDCCEETIDDCGCNNPCDCCEPCNSCCTKFKAVARTEFIVKTTSDKICRLLQKLQKACISLDYVDFQDIRCNQNLFKFVVGTANEETSSDLKKCREILGSMCFCYLENIVVKVTSSDSNPTTIGQMYSALNSCVKIYSFSSALTCGIYFDVDGTDAAIEAMESLN